MTVIAQRAIQIRLVRLALNAKNSQCRAIVLQAALRPIPAHQPLRRLLRQHAMANVGSSSAVVLGHLSLVHARPIVIVLARP